MLSTADICLRLGAAVLAGGLVGINREMHSKPVGVRTLGLVALGAALVTLAGSGFSDDGADANAGRAIQGIVTGIGFLGAGVIVKREGRGRVHGLTTARGDLGDGGARHRLRPRRLPPAGARHGLPPRDPAGRRPRRPGHRRPAKAGERWRDGA